MKFLVLFALFALASAGSEPDFNDRTVKCTVCKYVMGEIEELLTDDSTEETILAKLDELCEKLSKPFLVNGCRTLVSEFVKPQLEDIIANRPTPEEACKEMELC
eukprot:TRINITY_DN2555_c0_g1_i1.p2 TRINITY_DN2555_c0_g1~~TRINITY_DN2555_c0_g1_i1.p2  ORF type:complete len:104 (-),score=43.67 TRINITY_DN2555_c0_g1_i1:72-383(-)